VRDPLPDFMAGIGRLEPAFKVVGNHQSRVNPHTLPKNLPCRWFAATLEQRFEKNFRRDFSDHRGFRRCGFNGVPELLQLLGFDDHMTIGRYLSCISGLADSGFTP